MLRRFVALITLLFTANLTMVGSDFVCGEHSGDVAGHVAMTRHGHATMSGPGEHHEEIPCHTPAVPMCCQALSSCAIALSPAASQSEPLILRLAASVLESRSEAPRSEIIAPDPPPPRA